jgi:hypothetical protein
MAKPSEPADTRMMGIVHGALRRDLLRAREVVSSAPYPEGHQRRALGEHVVWLMDFLHTHHSGEDIGLWPAVRKKTTSVDALLESLEADHRQIEPAADAVRATGERYAATSGDDVRLQLTTVLDDLAVVLFPHLDREVEEAMPVVSQTLTNGEWHAIEKQHFIKVQSLSQLGFLAHWLLDGIDSQGREVVLHTVPALPRFVLVHGFARAYQRRVRTVWKVDKEAIGASTR